MYLYFMKILSMMHSMIITDAPPPPIITEDMVTQLAHTVVDVENSSIHMCPFFPASLKENANKIHIL